MTAIVPRRWPDSTIACLGAGPSLTAEDADVCLGRSFLVAVGDAYTLAPCADVLYHADTRWWKAKKDIPGSRLPNYKYGIDPAAREWRSDLVTLDRTGSYGLELSPHGLRSGGHSGYQAINLAVHLGARRIILLGYDMLPSEDGRHHLLDEQPSPTHLRYDVWLGMYHTLLEPLQTLGITVVNASRRTAIDAFPRMSLQEALQCA